MFALKRLEIILRKGLNEKTALATAQKEVSGLGLPTLFSAFKYDRESGACVVNWAEFVSPYMGG